MRQKFVRVVLDGRLITVEVAKRSKGSAEGARFYVPVLDEFYESRKETETIMRFLKNLSQA